ncbi:MULTISPECIES: PIG-L deacetylase family protein [Clostridium]|uniref:PIG-L deacetylase family protein n=1 Tax=Clostridium TaxID=1485 RepID=UPI00024BA096|nr:MULTISPECIES: PIG-L deacetylase family protein [Clostridium]HDK7167344.1 PIG-L family deacetylase [Clostridium botulinum]EHN13950.1 LmbE-like protein [Clostridium sporogenes PA 3679]MBE6055741.1 PIG-L family deacetylase [Clostridium sp.]MCW6107407.1 PIG-L family deacetylase [Clostridium sporogenes]NFF67593.1 PIG-L family deacetylase [Clostridium sporogenes]
MKKILVIAAHPDDEILGVGGTVLKHTKDGDECFGLILGEGMTSRYNKRELADSIKVEKLHEDTYKAAKIIGYKKVYMENLPDNRFDSVSLLDIIKIIEKHIENIKPDIIYTHFGGDLNIDHKMTFEAVLTATRPIGNEYVKEIYAFETVSSTEWNFSNPSNFKPNYFIDITETLDGKLKAMEYYKSELREFPHPRSNKNLEASALKWGSVISRDYAEAFEVIRIIK